MLGIAHMLVAVTAGVATSLVVKTLSAEFAVLVVLSVRFLFSVPPLAVTAFLVRGRAMLRINRWERLVMRIVAGHASITFWFLAIAHTGLGQATALSQTAAIFVTILAPLVLKERIGVYRGGAVVAGLFGIYLITDPLSGGASIGSVYGIACALAGAALVVVLRLLGKTEEPVSVAVWHNSVGAAVFTSAVLVAAQTEMLGRVVQDHIALLLVLGVGAAIVQIGFTSAYRYGEAAVLIPVRYTSVPAAGVLGWIVWDERLTAGEMAGMAIVVLSCAFISIREYWLSLRNNTSLAEHVEEHRKH